MSKRNGVVFMEVINGNGKYFIDGIWVGNFYTDNNGIVRDTETNMEI